MKAIRITLILVVVLGFPAAGAWCADDLEASYYLWRMINEARRNPLETLEKIGIDEQAARESLGIDQWILDQNLPPLAWNQNLFDAASKHNQDMGENLYYSHDSLDGTTYLERIEASGYNALFVGESLGALSFGAYLDPLKAAEILFEFMLKDELDPSKVTIPKSLSLLSVTGSTIIS